MLPEEFIIVDLILKRMPYSKAITLSGGLNNNSSLKSEGDTMSTL